MSDDKVVSLDEKRADKQPHIEGPVRCMRCGHEWRAVSPQGSDPVGLECPECHAEVGIRQGLVERDVPHLECNCGCSFFTIHADDQALCVNCGQHFGVVLNDGGIE